MPTSEQVADRARSTSEKGTDWGVGMCLKAARTIAGAPSDAHDAAEAWRKATLRHTGVPPRGYPVFWTGGTRGFGHVAISDGGGYVWSTDIKRPGRVDRVSLAYLAARWPNLHYAGWAETINGVTITGPNTSAAVPTVQLANLRPGLGNDDVRDLQLALRRHGMGALNPSGATGYFAPNGETLAMCQAFQRKQGWTGADADGIPGPKTCALLGLHVI